MNEKNIYRTLWGAIVVLLLMNIGMIGWIWFMSNKSKPPPPEKFYLEQELSFSEQQKATYRKLRESYLAEMRASRDSIKPMKEMFLKRVTGDSLSDEELMKISVAIEAKSAQGNVLTFKHLRQVRNMCTPAQRQKFDGIIDKIAFQMAKPTPPPPRREDGRPPRDDNRPRDDDRPPPPEDGERPPRER